MASSSGWEKGFERKFSAGLDAVHAGHHHVQDHKVGLGVLLYVLHRRKAVGGLGRLIVAAQQQVQDVPDVRVVVHNQDFCRFAHIYSSKRGAAEEAARAFPFFLCAV